MDFERYSRQISIDKFGEKGQQKLAQSCVTVIGAGGLGSPAIYYLAAAGVGNMRIADADKVEISNLNRQLLYFESDIGKSKAGAAKEKVNLFNSGVKVSAYDLRADGSNIADMIKGSDIVLSCADNLETRFIINGACVKQNIAMADGGVGGFRGYVFTMVPGVTPCYKCVFGSETENRSGVFGAAAGVVGAALAVQAIKYLLGEKEEPHLLFIDMLNMEFQKAPVKRNPACPVCGNK